MLFEILILTHKNDSCVSIYNCKIVFSMEIYDHVDISFAIQNNLNDDKCRKDIRLFVLLSFHCNLDDYYHWDDIIF